MLSACSNLAGSPMQASLIWEVLGQAAHSSDLSKPAFYAGLKVEHLRAAVPSCSKGMRQHPRDCYPPSLKNERCIHNAFTWYTCLLAGRKGTEPQRPVDVALDVLSSYRPFLRVSSDLRLNIVRLAMCSMHLFLAGVVIGVSE
eukprot:scaffold174082_cov18-Tisochrysis_lutea.AAC.1